MRQSQASRAIFKRWMDMWPGLQPAVPYAFDNDVMPEGDVLARVGMVSLDSEQYTLGPAGRRLWERKAYIDVRLTGPSDVGRKELDLLVESIRQIYEGVRFGFALGDDGIVTHATSVSELKRDRDGAQLWVVQTLTPCEWWETR